MTEVRAFSRNGYTLVYDTDDIANANIKTLHHHTETDGPNGTIRRELTGYSSLDLHIDFKHDKCARWVQDEELAEAVAQAWHYPDAGEDES